MQRDANNTGSMQEFILSINLLQSFFPVNNQVQTMFTPISIPDKHTRELRINVNPMSKKLNFLRFYWLFLCFNKKKIRKAGEQHSIMSLSM